MQQRAFKQESVLTKFSSRKALNRRIVTMRVSLLLHSSTRLNVYATNLNTLPGAI
jgi:hypothetical protein